MPWLVFMEPMYIRNTRGARKSFFFFSFFSFFISPDVGLVIRKEEANNFDDSAFSIFLQLVSRLFRFSSQHRGSS